MVREKEVDLQKSDDCYFYYYSFCSKGDRCPFRHEPTALGNETVCNFWKSGGCTRKNCGFRHMNITVKRNLVPCYWESQPSGCLKIHCPFLHKGMKPIEKMEEESNCRPLQRLTNEESMGNDSKSLKRRMNGRPADGDDCRILKRRMEGSNGIKTTNTKNVSVDSCIGKDEQKIRTRSWGSKRDLRQKDCPKSQRIKLCRKALKQEAVSPEDVLKPAAGRLDAQNDASPIHLSQEYSNEEYTCSDTSDDIYENNCDSSVSKNIYSKKTCLSSDIDTDLDAVMVDSCDVLKEIDSILGDVAFSKM